MVRLTAEYIERKCSQAQLIKSLSSQVKKDRLFGLTHLRMNDKFISSLGNFAICKNLKVIYLQNNNITKIENLHFATNLTHLYLQHNAITKMENFDCLEMLETLYLGYNDIGVLEGLENLKRLSVLHVENQRLPTGESLCFDPRTILALSACLKVLNISGNKIASLREVGNLYELEVLDARNNLIDDIDDLTETVSNLVFLKDLSLQGNPVVHRYRYKENLIANNCTLENLNGTTVTDVCRRFMKRFKMEKHLRRTRKSSKIRLEEDITSTLNLPPAFKRSISRAMFQHGGPQMSISVLSTTGEVRPQIFPSWKTAPGTNAARGSRITPRPFWSNVTKPVQFSKVRCSSMNGKRITLPPI